MGLVIGGNAATIAGAVHPAASQSVSVAAPAETLFASRGFCSFCIMYIIQWPRRMFRAGSMGGRMTEKPVAIVTGVGPATGSAIVRRFSAGGFRVVALARSAERINALAPRLPDVPPITCDV